MTVDQAMQTADRLHRAGRREEAETICQQVLGQQPNHPDALHLLGILQAQAGRLDTACELIGRATQLRPGFAQAWANLGCVLVNDRKFEEALGVYNRLMQLRSEDANPHYAAGILLRELERTEEAIAAFVKATQLQPHFADAHFRLGVALRDQGRLDDAVAAYSKAIALRPDWADARNNLANVLRDKRLLDEAIVEYSKAVELKPDDAVIRFNLGNVLYQKERLADALSAYEVAVRLKADYFEAYRMMSLVLGGLLRFDEAAQAHQRAVALRPDDACTHEALGSAMLFKQDAVAAEASFRRSLELSPDSATAWNGLGMALRSLGRFEDAADCFRRALAINPDRPSFHRNLISIGGLAADAKELERLSALFNQSNLPLVERIEAGFALGKLLDDADRFNEAFACYQQANGLLKQWRPTADEGFDADKLHRVVDGMTEGYTTQFFGQRSLWGEATELPVFIVGMPRSGTTLIEQIAASHPSVFGAGELTDIGRMAEELALKESPTSGRGWNAASIAKAASAHLKRLRSLDATALRIIDKMPHNVFHLGLIAVLFPSARVIFCRRDARDNCLSCYFQRLADTRHRYSDLADCGRQWLETDRLINHWLQVLPLKMLEMHYEEMVADQESQSRRLIDFLGLPWDPACLEFYKTQRTVVTASFWQVRQPIYTRSVGRWRRYERHLGPLFDVLESRAEKQVSNLPPDTSAQSGRSSWDTDGFFREFSLGANPRVAAVMAGNANPVLHVEESGPKGVKPP
jgi:tetratricopeptide (TPR) repeat protein